MRQAERPAPSGVGLGIYHHAEDTPMSTPRTSHPEQAKPAVHTVSVKRFDGKTTRQPAAFAFLMRQHRAVEAHFDDFENAESDAEKAALAQQICLALAVHAKIEEELLYPQARGKIEDDDLVDEAAVEHATAKDLIAQIETMRAGDPLFDAKIKVLSEYIAHHVEEEETELFPQIKKTDIDLTAMAQQLESRSEAVEAELSAGGERQSKRRVAAEAKAGAHI
jgi:hemerythrin-like domain-containing protein